MDTATTGPPARKRVAIDDPGVTTKTKTPSEKASSRFQTHVESLLPAIASLAKHFHNQFIKLMRRAHSQSINIERFAIDNFCPHSANIKFRLGGTERLLESTEFKTLADTTQQKVDAFQLSLTRDILSAAELERKTTMDDVKRLFCKAVNKFSHVTLLRKTSFTETEDTDTINITHLLAKKCVKRYAPSLLRYIKSSVAEFETLYEELFPDSKVEEEGAAPASATTPSSQESEVVVWQNRLDELQQTDADAPEADTFEEHTAIRNRREEIAQLSQQINDHADQASNPEEDDTEMQEPDAPTPGPADASIPSILDAQRVANLLENTFNDPWASFLKEHDSRALNAKLMRYTELAIKEPATADAADKLETEVPTDRATLDALLDRKVAEKTKALAATVTKLQQQMSRSKNCSRGDTPSRASQKKKSNKGPPNQQQKKKVNNNNSNRSSSKPRKGKADGKERATPPKSGKRKQGKSKRKNTATNRPKNQRSNRPNGGS